MRRNHLITGVSSGIGFAIALKLLSLEDSVLGISRTKPDISSPNFYFSSVDLSSSTDFSSYPQKYPDIDSIILSAGIGYFGNLEELSPQKMQELMQVNFFSQILLIKTFLPFLKQKERADIICIGSEAAIQGKKQGSIYCASKFALKGFMQSLQEECRNSSVKITLLQPGMVMTPFFTNLSFRPEKSSHLLAEDIAETVQWLLTLPSRAVCEELCIYPKKRLIEKSSSYHQNQS